jgi:hypothetical protein
VTPHPEIYRELVFDVTDLNIRSGIQIAQSRQSGIGQVHL